MNTAQAPAWLPAKLVPFFTLSYPTAPPLHPDSFLESNYYGTGLLDGWLIITAIAIMAVLRDMFGKNDRRQLKRRCIVHGIFLSTHLNVNGEDVSSRSQDLFGGQLAVRVTSKKIIGVIV